MAEESEKYNSPKRRGWVQSLAVCSSDNEDSDAGSMIEPVSTSSVDTGQVIALRFPYPMFSDESEEENTLRYLPSGCSSGKRKISPSSDENITISKENHSYKHKKRKIKQNTNENHIKENHNYDKKLASQNVGTMSNTILKSQRNEASNRNEVSKRNEASKRNKASNRNEASNIREKSSSLSYRTSKRPRNVLKPVSVHYSSSDSDNVFQDKTVVIRINPRRCKQIYNKIVDSTESSDDEGGKVKVINDESNLLTSAKPTSRFLDSSSEVDNVKCSAKRKKLKVTNSSKPNFRRLHFLSTSSSSSDEDAEQKVNECKLYTKKSSVVPCHSISTSSNEKENDSDTNFIPVKDKIVHNKVNTSSVEPCHSISASSDEKDSDNDIYFVPAVHKGNRVKNPNVSFSDSSNNSNESRQINKIINSSELEYRARKRYLQNRNIKTGRPNLNSSAWKNIAKAELKAEAKSSSHQSIVQNLKKKLLSFNMSSIEVHKKMHSRPITTNKEVEGRSDSTKRLKLSLKSHDKLEDLISGRLGDVSVTDVSEDNCTKENISVDKSELAITPQVNSQEDDPRENLNVNVDSSQIPSVNVDGHNVSSDSTTESKQSNLETIASQGEYEDVNVNLPNKKIRHSHFNKINSNIQNVHPFQKQNSVINKRLNIHFKKAQSNNNNKSDEICSTKNATENSSIQCDVLGNILSQMENNPYKVQKVPAKKTAEPTGQMLGWSESHALTGQSQYHSGLINSQNVNKDILQMNRRQHTENVPIAYQNKMTTINTNITQNSTLPTYSPSNNRDALHNSKTNTNNEIRRVESIKPVNKSIDNKNMGKKRLPDSEIVMPFYSAHSEEYVGTNSNQGNNTKATTNNLSMPQNSSSKNASYKNVTNHMKGGKHKSTDDNRTRRKYKKAIVDTDIRRSGKLEHNYEENIKTKVSSRNPKQFSKQNSNKRSIKRKMNSGEKSDDNVPGNIKEPIKIGPFICTDLAGNVKINGEKKKEFLAKQTNNVANETPPKGIRIRFGGNVFRLTGGANMTKENNNLNTGYGPENIVTNKATTKFDSKRRSSVGYDANEPEKSQVITHTNCSQNQNTDHPLSKSDNESSSSDETSDSSSSKSDSTDDLNINMTNSTTDISVLEGKSSSASDSRLNSIQEDGMEEKRAGASVIQNATKETLIVEKEGIRKSKSLRDNSTSDNVIILLDSSDSENGDGTINIAYVSEVKTDTPNITTQLEKNSNSNEIDQNNILSAGKVGTIRVKSLKELGVCSNNPLPENALPSTVSVSESPSVDLDLNLPKALPLQDSMLNKLLDRVHNEEIRPSPPKSTIPSQPLVCNLDKLFQALPKSTESHKHQQKAVAVIKPVCSNSTSTSNSNSDLANSLEKANNTTESVIQQNLSPAVPPLPANTPITTARIPNTENVRESLQTHENATKFIQVPLASKETETLFFKLYDSLFTELVYFKIPKLVDDLHLSIVYDIMKEERLKKIDQLISPETIAIEKRRAEKDFADMIKIRGQSFVPLFMTIVNKINKVDLKSLVVAVYCRIVQQLERVDPMNSSYRFKLRHLIKSMIEKFSYGKHNHDLCTIFGESDTSFITSFVFIENLLLKYDKCLEERRLASVQLELTSKSGDNNTSTGNNTNPHPTVKSNTVSNMGSASTLASVTESVVAPTEVERVQHPPVNVSGPPPPPIGNLDQMLLFKLKTPPKPHAM